MGSSSKKVKESSGAGAGGSSGHSRKRKHRSRSPISDEERERDYEYREREQRERRHHKHKRHHHHHSKERKHDRKHPDYDSNDSDVVEVQDQQASSHSEHQSEPISSGGGGQESLSIEETNKLRAKLGLKPLQAETTSASSDPKKDDGKKKDDLGEFYHKPASNIAEKQKSEKIREKLAAHREKRAIENKLARVKTLGESESDDDASAWVSKNRKISNAKKEADKRAKMLEELDAQFGIGDVIEQEKRDKRRKAYTDKSLKGLAVEHDLDMITEGKDVVLTLKDSGVLDEEEDVLVNVNLLDDERYKKNIDTKKKKIQYNPYDVEEFDEFGNPIARNLLDKYDEEIEGERKERFRLGIDNFEERRQRSNQTVKEKLEAKKRLESLASEITLASDFYNEQEMAKFKKPKKKVRKIREKGKLLSADELEALNNSKTTGIEEVGTRRTKKEEMHIDIDDMPDMNVNLDDIKLEEEDDALERALHKARTLKQREVAGGKPTESLPEITPVIKPEIKDEPEDDTDTGKIILNATAEFCRTLGDIPTYGKSGNREETEEILDFDKADMDIEKSDDEDDDCQIIEPTEGSSWNQVDINKTEEVPILDEEPDVSTGVGAALKLAMSKGYLDKEESNRPSNTRLAYLQAKHYSIEDKNYGDDGERGGRRERYAGPVQDFKEKDSFKPNVKLEYIDDDGHVLNSKEAFRYLSHKFHGKGPGKNKVEKRIKKNLQEGLMKKMSSTDTPLGTLNMLQAKQKEIQSPYIVLSGGKTHSTSISKAGRS